MTRLNCLQKLLCGLLVAGVLGLLPTQATAQLRGTPFDPGTWNPADWVAAPEVGPVRSRLDLLRINNRTSDSAWACFGTSSAMLGWFEIKPGQTFSYKLPYDKNHLLKMRVMHRGKPVHWDNAPTFISHTSTPFHPKKAFNLKRENGAWRLTIEGRNLGVYNSQGLDDRGIEWAKFEKFKVERQDIGFNIN